MIGEQAKAALDENYQRDYIIAAIDFDWLHGSKRRGSDLEYMSDRFKIEPEEKFMAGLDTLASLLHAELGQTYVATQCRTIQEKL